MDDVGAYDNSGNKDNNDNDKPRLNQFVSFEMFVEVFVSYVYYFLYYYALVLELCLINHVKSFILITILHLSSEMCQSTIRLSKSYFDLTNYLIEGIVTLCDQYRVKHTILIGFVDKVVDICWKDDSTFEEWRVRQCIDKSLRFFCLVTAFISIVLYVLEIGYQNYGIETDEEFYRAVYYFMSSFSVDMLYYLIVFVINYFDLCHCCGWCACCTYKARKTSSLLNRSEVDDNVESFNVWQPFLMMFHASWKSIGWLFLLGFGLAVAIF